MVLMVNASYLLTNAQKKGYAVPSYNINNLEWAKYVLEACNDDNSPVILAVTEKTVNYLGGYKIIYNMVKSLIIELNIKVPVVLHLDHGTSFESCKMAIDAGFTSVMIDASKLSLDQNVSVTNRVIDYAKTHDVSVEAEIGTLFDEAEGDGQTTLELAGEFVSRTNVDFLAPAIGNKHGIYKEDPTLNFELLGAICKEVRIPLVLHGSSGLDDNKIKTAIFCGVSKINVNTDLMLAWSHALRKYLDNNKEAYDPRDVIGSGEKALKHVIHLKNELFGSKNKA